MNASSDESEGGEQFEAEEPRTSSTKNFKMEGPHTSSLNGYALAYKGKTTEELRTDLIGVCARSCKSWKGAQASDPEIQAVQVRGGITNLLYLVVDTRLSIGEQRSLLVRLYGERTDRLIDREKDIAIVKAMSGCGFGAPCFATFENGRVEGFLENHRALTLSEMRRKDVRALVLERLGELHSLPVDTFPLAREAGMQERSPAFWRVVSSWFARANEISFDGSGASSEAERHKARMLELLDVARIGKELVWLKTVLPSPENGNRLGEFQVKEVGGHGAGGELGSTQTPAAAACAFVNEIVFAHNDMTAGNVLWDGRCSSMGGGGTPKGSKGTSGLKGEEAGLSSSLPPVVLIDYEYGGWNFRGFDLANLFCELVGFDPAPVAWFKTFPSDAEVDGFIEDYLRALRRRLLSRSGKARTGSDRESNGDASGGGGGDSTVPSTPLAEAAVAAVATEDDHAEEEKGRAPERERGLSWWERRFILGVEEGRAEGGNKKKQEEEEEEGQGGGGNEPCFDADFIAAIRTRVRAFVLASHIHWALWGIVQAKESPIDFDFLEYSVDRMRGYFLHKGLWATSIVL